MLNPNRLGLSLFVVATILLGKRFAPKFPVSLIVGPARRDLRAGSITRMRGYTASCGDDLLAKGTQSKAPMVKTAIIIQASLIA